VQGTVAQSVALTIFGNDVLHGVERNDFWPNSTAFKFCKAVSFVSLSGPLSAPEESPFAENPVQWISRLKSEGTIGLRLHHTTGNDPTFSDRMTVGFVGGGGRRLIESTRPSASDLWEARWRVQDQNEPDRRIWAVVYYRVDVNRAPVEPPRRGLAALRAELEVVLSKLEDFAIQQHLTAFAGSFRQAIDGFGAERPLATVYHSDIAPSTRISPDAKILLAAAQAAWVFGGMGSWNDLAFEGQADADYNLLSDRLFSLLVQTVQEAANDGFADQR
jgi:hypothetical protein